MPTEKQLKYWKSMKGGNRSGFKKGHKFYKGGEKGWFKKGQIPHNFRGDTIPYRRKHSLILEPEKCEICGKRDTKKKLCYDHNHETGKFRGWLCMRCNTTLGLVEENTEILSALIRYINKHNN